MDTGYSKWRKLDNAALAFPLVSGKNDTRVFRFYCQLKEMVNGELLQTALDQTMEKYPLFQAVLRKGLFWFYLEHRDIRATVKQETEPPCSRLYIPDKKSLLFQVTYYKNRINFEVFHALTDGTGATEFLRELVKNYLYLMHEKDGLENVILTEQDLTVKDQEEDGFGRYYNPDERGTRKKKNHAYQIRRESKEYEELQIGETTASVKELLEVSRKHGVSMSVFLTAAMICAIHEEQSKIQEKKPVILMVPVNLRKIFPSDSMLNFFSYIEPGYRFGEGKDSFDDVLEATKQYFEENLSKEKIAERMNNLIAYEKHKILKWAPLELKNRCIKMGAKLAEREVTAVLSNMSVVKMPSEYAKYIERFGVYTSTMRTELCVCSFGDTLSFAFTSRYDSTNIQRNFYRILKEQGIFVKKVEADYPKEAKPNYEGKKVFQIFNFCCIAAVVLCIMLNLTLTPDLHWWIFAVAGGFSMWLAFATGYLKRYNLLKNAMWQLLIVSIGSILWDIFTGWQRWSVDLVLPLVCLIVEILMELIARIQSHPPKEYMIYYVMASVYSMVLPLILMATGVILYRAFAVICVGLSFLFFIRLLLFRKKEFKEEMYKKFHV